MNVINLLYRGSNNRAMSWHTTFGIKEAFERTGLLNYAFNVIEPESSCDYKKLLSHPIVIVKGYAHQNHAIIDKVYGKQFMASIETEPITKRDNEEDFLSGFRKEYARKFDLVFVHSIKDASNYFGRPTVTYDNFIDNELFKSTHLPTEEIAYIGSTETREEILKDITQTIGNFPIYGTPTDKDARQTAQRYIDAICKHKFLISLRGKTCKHLTARPFEIMSCGRVCFQYLLDEMQEEANTKHLIDGKNIIFFRSMEELKDKYFYYRKRDKECIEIGKCARDTIEKYHSIDGFAKKISKEVLDKKN